MKSFYSILLLALLSGCATSNPSPVAVGNGGYQIEVDEFFHKECIDTFNFDPAQPRANSACDSMKKGSKAQVLYLLKKYNGCKVVFSCYEPSKINVKPKEETKNKITPEVSTEDNLRVSAGKPTCYLTTVPIQPPIKSCDPNLIQRSLSGFDIVGMIRFISSSEMEFILIRPQEVAKIQINKMKYKIEDNLITTEPVSNCFVTHEVEEGPQFRKEFFKNASPGCPQHIINASKIGSEELKSGRDKGFLIVYE